MKKIGEIEFFGKIFYLCFINNKDGEEILLFLNSFYKSFGKRPSLDTNWFKWFYNSSPFGICRNFVLLDNDAKQIVGAFGFSPAQIRAKGQLKNIFIGVNGFINEPHTGKGLYTRLIQAGLGILGNNDSLFLSFPHMSNLASIKGHEKSGWEKIAKLQFLSKDLDLKLHQKINLSDFIISENLNDLVNYKYSLRSNIYVKSQKWVKWRFLERPNKKYCTVILYQENMIKAYVIYTFYKTPIKLRAQVADYEVKNNLFLEPILKVLELKVREQGADTLEFLVNKKSEDAEQIRTNGYDYIDDGYEMFQIKNSGNLKLDHKMKIDFSFFDVV